MRSALIYGIVAGLVLLGMADAVGTRIGLVEGALPRAAGPSAWISSRAAGVAAYLALSLDVIFGLFISTGRADRWIARAQTVEVHRWLSGATLALVAAHALLLLADGYVRFDLLDAVVPFVDSYRPLAVGLGVIAAYLAAVVHASFSLRRRIGAAVWRKLHYLTFALFVLAAAHGLLAGTDARMPWMTATYATTAGVVLLLVLHRVLPLTRRHCAASAAASSAGLR
jgi:predicted ferric reductase